MDFFAPRRMALIGLLVCVMIRPALKRRLPHTSRPVPERFPQNASTFGKFDLSIQTMLTAGPWLVSAWPLLFLSPSTHDIGGHLPH